MPYTGVGSAYNIPCDSTIAYSIPNSFRYLSASGTYPHSGSQIPLGCLPKYFLYVWTPTAICALTVFSLTNKIGKKPCVAPQVIISKTPISDNV